ncbi:MAG: hypothetical protein OEU92_02510, partial [Alphaproteobacteria bacterium]|nr:hypothetical protein [Alphaproteobacteria bacterium]
KDVIGKPLLYTPDHSIADHDALAFIPIHTTTFGGMTAAAFDIPAKGAGVTFGLPEEDVLNNDSPPIDADALADAISQGRENAYETLRDAYQTDNEDEMLEPMVLRARAGECIVVRLNNRLRHNVDSDGVYRELRSVVDDNDCVSSEDDPSCASEGNAHLHGEEGYDPRHLPRIVKMNAIQLQASDWVGITPQQVQLDVAGSGGIMVGWNESNPTLSDTQIAWPDDIATYVWYAGEMRTKRVSEDPDGTHVLQPEWEPQALGPINLSSLVDPIEHGQQGLIGALIVEEADAVAYDPDSRRKLPDLPNGTSAYIDPDGRYGKAKPFHEFVLLYQDGLNLRWHNPDEPEHDDIEAVPDCLVCDDSYDRGEKGANYRTEPFWARLNQHPTTDLNSRQFPPEFFLDDWKTVATPGYEVTEGEAVTFHVLQPYGRARQRAFMVLGHDYLDLLPHFGSRHSALISVGKAVEAELSTTAKPGSRKAARGDWIWRDGPAQHFSSGVWGTFEVEAK